ncbi:MAG: 4-alpha-glucanotransferase [Acidimicrobiales bacterium]
MSNEAHLLQAWGVEPGYWDVSGHWHDVPETTLRLVMETMGAGTSGTVATGPPLDAPLFTATQNGPWPYLPGGTLTLENGGTIDLPADGPRPEELPLGYHRFEPAEPSTAGSPDACPRVVAVCPARCPGPPPGRTWGWSAQLYATRSGDSWGIGDFADLRSLVGWAGANGAGFVLVNPLNAPAPGPVPEPSPYFPSSRCFLNPLYIRVEEVPGAGDLAEIAALGLKAKALNAERLIDRTRVWALKSEALEALFIRFEQLAERFGLPWQDWPAEYRHPDGAAVARSAAGKDGRSRKRYHAWLQWLCEAQLANASSGGHLLFDLAVGVDRGGADAWFWQGAFAMGMRVGAPPDEFNTKGQDWGLPPWDPWKLRAAAYEPFIETLRAVLRPAAGLRVDHVMGLFRLFWVPLGSEAAEGTYVRYPWHDMVALLRLEAARAGAFIVGEDLGTVEDHVRAVLFDSGVLSYRLFWFEDERPSEWSYQALGAVTTHDLPTIAGVWTGFDIEAQRSAGLAVNEQSSGELRRRLSEWTGSNDNRPLREVIEATYATLAQAPCALIAAVLDDVTCAEERPNMPGTIDEWPNWCLALPLPLEKVERSELAAAISRALSSKEPG